MVFFLYCDAWTWAVEWADFGAEVGGVGVGPWGGSWGGWGGGWGGHGWHWGGHDGD